MYVFAKEHHGKTLSEQGVEMFAGERKFFGAAVHEREVLHANDALQGRHAVLVQVFPYLVAHEQQACLAVVDDVVYIIRLELVQDGHDDGAVGNGGQKRHAPVSAVASAQGDFVAGPDILAILRATSLYCKLSPLKSVNAFRSQFFFMLFSISSISLSSISFGRISWYRRQKYKKQGISVSLWETILNFGRKFFCNFKSLSSPVSFANHPSSFSEYHKLFKTKRLQPEGCFIHLSAMFQSAPMRAEKTFGG